MSLKLKRFNQDDPNYYLHNKDQPLACPFAAGGSVTQVLYPDTKLTIGGQQPSPISDNQPRRVTCGTWCALFRIHKYGYISQRCSDSKNEQDAATIEP